MELFTGSVIVISGDTFFFRAVNICPPRINLDFREQKDFPRLCMGLAFGRGNHHRHGFPHGFFFRIKQLIRLIDRNISP